MGYDDILGSIVKIGPSDSYTSNGLIDINDTRGTDMIQANDLNKQSYDLNANTSNVIDLEANLQAMKQYLDNTDNATDSKVQDKTIAINDENIKLKQQISDLQAKLNDYQILNQKLFMRVTSNYHDSGENMSKELTKDEKLAQEAAAKIDKYNNDLTAKLSGKVY